MKETTQHLKIILSAVFLLSLVLLQEDAFAELTNKERNILVNEAKAIDLAKALVTDNSWNKFPDYKNRQFWESLPLNIRRDYIIKAESFLDYNWPVVKATDYLEFIRSGERRQEVYAACSNALISLVMGELVEGEGRFIDQIINAVWYYSEQTWWGWSAHLYFQKSGTGLPDKNDPTVDLGVGEVTNNLSWTLYLFKDEFDKVHPLISARLKQEITDKALVPYFTRDDFGYMGFKGGRPNNWNPWVNYNMLMSYLLVENDPSKKVAEVQKIINSLDKFLNGYSDDGGCDEGPSYWGAAGALLYENLEILKNVTGDKFDVFGNPLIQNIGKYFYKVNIHAPYFINFADADATTGGNGSAVYRYGKAIKDPQMQQFGAYLAKLGKWGEGSFGGKICDQIRNLSLLNEISNAESKESLVSEFWLPDTEVAGARDKEGSYLGFFFGAKGGFNAESHNHNDVGSFVLYYDGKPCIIDLGREEYNAKTFSSKRYEIWTMQSGYHNLPVINGIEQKDGAEFKAKKTTFTSDPKSAKFSTDISGAYPKDALVNSWIRSYKLNRGKNFVVDDKYNLASLSKMPTGANFMTCCKVSEIKPGLLKLEGDGFTLNMSYNARLASCKIENIILTDRSLKKYWPENVRRIRLDYLNPALKGEQTVTFTPAVKNHN
jgi:hypothetical protein